MATATAHPRPTPAPPLRSERIYRITIDRYMEMIRAGVFNEKDPVFLRKGRLIEKMTKGVPHTNTVIRFHDLLGRSVPEGWHVRQDAPIGMGDDGMPEPDLTVARGSLDDYPDRHPTTADVALLVEVPDSSFPEDAGEVLEAYAEMMIPVYWIANIPDRRIEVHSDPSSPAAAAFYRTVQTFAVGDEVPIVLDGREVGRVAVSAIFP